MNRTWKLALLFVIEAIVIALIVGVVQNHNETHRFDQCKEIKTGTSFKGYDCGKNTFYLPKQH